MGTEGGGYDFPVVSDRPGEELIGAPPGSTVIVDEPIYPPEAPDPYGHGNEEIGTVTIVQFKGQGNRIPFAAHFAFNDGDSVSLTGFVPGNGSWKGKGVVAYGGGTGKFASRAGQLDLQSDNPKRWG
jgi:hypothetical protein